ncbi:MAG: hypothetical protein ABSC47_11130 [Terracidiphilus sp.]
MTLKFKHSLFHKVGIWLFALFGQFFLAVILSTVLGFFPEVVFDSRIQNTALAPFFPVIAIVALLLGYFLHPVVTKRIGATSVWIVGLLWLGYGIWETSSGWSPSWSAEPTRWSYMAHNLFGKTPQCSATECLGELIYTIPFVVSVM